jgi:hypothetical protein
MLWRVAAAIFALINLGGAAYAAMRAEPLHAAVHVVLLLGGAYLAWWLAPRAGHQDLPRAQHADERLEQLQQSLDAIAIEVERIGEAQRFSAKLQAERAKSTPLDRP